MPLYIDVVIDADTAHAPLGEHVGLDRQRLERRPVELFEQLPAPDAGPAALSRRNTGAAESVALAAPTFR